MAKSSLHDSQSQPVTVPADKWERIVDCCIGLDWALRNDTDNGELSSTLRCIARDLDAVLTSVQGWR